MADLLDVYNNGVVHVVNKHNHIPTDHDYYIGRGSVLGNPYSHMKGTRAKFKVSTREKAIQKYRGYIFGKLTNGDKEIWTAINDIRKIITKYGEVNLVCYCVPLPCHGLIIKEIVEQFKTYEGY